MIDQYNATESRRPRNIIMVVGLSLTIRGFIVTNHYGIMLPDFMRDMAKWRRKADEMDETIYDGIERAPEAFIGLFKGENFGQDAGARRAGQGGLAFYCLFSTAVRIAAAFAALFGARLVPLLRSGPLSKFWGGAGNEPSCGVSSRNLARRPSRGTKHPRRRVLDFDPAESS